jgi:hypothetical protein
MKTQISISLILIIIVTAFIFKKAESGMMLPLPGGNISDEFLIGAMSNGWDDNYHRLADTLNFNVWHRYNNGGYDNGSFWIKGWSEHDSLETPLNRYIGEIQQILGENQDYHMRTLMERPKTTRLAYGQRSDYQCEEEEHIANHDYWFYTFQDHGPGTDIPDSGAEVRFCRVENSTTQGSIWDNPGFVARRLKANNEQCNTNYGRWEGDNYYQWLIKPRIRIDSSFAATHPEAKVCKVIVINWNGDTIKQADIRARNFKFNLDSTYHGQYIEEYYFQSNLDTSRLMINSGNDFNPDNNFWAFSSRGNNTDPLQDICKADIQVYWYGNCDMWLDYVRVDNDVADGLFKGYYEGLDPNHPERQWLQWEAHDLVNGYTTPLRFYIEEFEFNNIPCMAYVSKRLSYYSGGAYTLMCDLNYTTYNAHLPLVNNYPQLDFDHVKRCLLDSVGSTELFAGSYALLGRDTAGLQANEDSRIPISLRYHDFNIEAGRLAIPVEPADYDNWLQRHFDTNWVTFHEGEFSYYMKMYDYLSKQKDIPFINLSQAHLWYTSGEKRREPTNEELEMMTDLAITYGSRGNLYFWYGGFNDAANHRYGYGLLDNESPVTPRYENAYGQEKWNKVKLLDSKLKTWGQYLMSFNNADRHSYIYRLESERDQMYRDNSYIHALRTFKPGEEQLDCSQDNLGFQNPEGLVFDCPDSTYLQAATFKPGSFQAYTNYFMVVNRRCSPIKEGYPDGKRNVRILFYQDYSAFEGYTNWEIIDLGNPDAEPIVFNKSVYALQDLGDYMPGEGRLYEIVPAVIRGGTLVGNENISGVEFTCLDTVYNNGYSITIGSGTTIHFTDSSKIIMNGGTFQMGGPNYSL